MDRLEVAALALEIGYDSLDPGVDRLETGRAQLEAAAVSSRFQPIFNSPAFVSSLPAAVSGGTANDSKPTTVHCTRGEPFMVRAGSACRLRTLRCSSMGAFSRR